MDFSAFSECLFPHVPGLLCIHYTKLDTVTGSAIGVHGLEFFGLVKIAACFGLFRRLANIRPLNHVLFVRDPGH